jgi:hypothetical protein
MAGKMNKVSGPYWKIEPELVAYLQKEPLCLNPHLIQAPLEHLQTLYSNMVGGIILVTKQFYLDGSALPPYNP